MKQQNYALLINDMQNDFVLPDAVDKVNGAYETVPILQNLLAFFRDQALPVFHLVRSYREDGSDVEITRLPHFMSGKKYALPGTKGQEIIDELKPIDGEYTITRSRFSGFMQTELEFILRRLQVDHLVICGTQYPNCVRATAYDGICYGYDVTVITDATSAATKQIADANILDMQNIGIDCINYEQYLDQLHKKQHRRTKTEERKLA